MNSLRKYLVALGIIALFIVIYFTGFFVKKSLDNSENLVLKKENQELLAQVQRSVIPGYDLPKRNGNYLVVKVFSVYPFNTRNEIIVNAGTKEGVNKSAFAVWGENILIGQVKETDSDSAIIQTIFDPGFEMPVRIGSNEVDGLLQGSSDPKIILIGKDKEVAGGDLVYSAQGNIPYGLKIGEIVSVTSDATSAFKEATVKIPFNVSDLREISLILNQ